MLELSGAEDPRQRQHAVTSRPMMSKYDPWVNMLRTTVAAFAAGVGGADSVTVLPFDSPLGRPDAFGRRIARNTCAPAHRRVARRARSPTRPAARTPSRSSPTTSPAPRGRSSAGSTTAPTSTPRSPRPSRSASAEIATRKRPITGLTEFPNLGETLPEREPATRPTRYAATAPASRRCATSPPATPVFLATLGTVAAAHRPGDVRHQPARGRRHPRCGRRGTHDGQPVVCLAGTDAAYDESGAETAAELRENGAEWVIVAGKPRDWADDSCAMGVDALEFLTRTRERLPKLA